MTAQMPDELDNQCPALDLNGLDLYGIVRGDITTNHGWGEPYVFRCPPGRADSGSVCSALWRGHIAKFRIDADGRVMLVGYAYPTFEVIENDLRRTDRTAAVGELQTGDLWLVLKRRFFGPRVYVPARDGRLLIDRAAWVLEPDEGPSIFEDV